MNLELADTLDHNIPDQLEAVLDCGSMAVSCAFNRWGSLLAVGCNDGRVVIWDFLTRGVAQSINAHVHPVCSLSWSRTGHKLLSGSTDCTVFKWDVISGRRENSYRFPNPVVRVQFHPRDDSIFLVNLMKHPAVLVDLAGSPHRLVPLPSDEDGDCNAFASFDHRGRRLYAGNGRGEVTVFDSRSLQVVASFRLSPATNSSSTSIRSIEFSRRGGSLLLNVSDKIIRVYDERDVVERGIGGRPEPLLKLQNQVDKTTWIKCCFTGDGEYVIGGSSRHHSTSVWRRADGQLSRLLTENRSETLLDAAAHPLRPIVVTVSGGLVSVWSRTVTENWSAFAPGFKELDENIEYEERESEFDDEDEDRDFPTTEEEERKREKDEDEDLEVDVVTDDGPSSLVSSDEEDTVDQLLTYIPISPEIEDAEESTWFLPPPLPPRPRPPASESAERRKRAGDGHGEPSSKRHRGQGAVDSPTRDVHPLPGRSKAGSGFPTGGGGKDKSKMRHY